VSIRNTAITIVGGGVAGLVAAIEAAERGANVELFEGRDVLGGRARSNPPPYVADSGPHALYPPGVTWDWLEARKLLPPTTTPLRRGYRVVQDGRLTIGSLRYAHAAAVLRGKAPVDVDFRTWARRRAGDQAAETASSLLIAFTYDYDPGRLSAAFCVPRFRRLVSPRLRVRYVIGGWQRLVDALELKATTLGVRIFKGMQVRELPEPPVIVATDPRNAKLLLGNDNLHYSTGRVAVLDVAIRDKKGLPTVVFDLDHPTVAVRHSSVDPSLVQSGEQLLEVATGFPPAEALDAAVGRIEEFLDIAFKGWRGQETWRRRVAFDMAAGAVDAPGLTWRDRPSIDYGNGVFLAGDWVAAPGLLSEVSFNSAVQAATKALQFAQQRDADGARLPTEQESPS
jgi:putative NAD(P)-binding protein